MHNDDKLRRKIAVLAASLIRRRQETHLHRARLRAARELSRAYVKSDQFPSDAEIRDEIERHSYVSEGDARFDNLRTVRLAALSVLRRYAGFDPRVVGPAWEGNVRSGAEIEVRISSEHAAEFAAVAGDVEAGFHLANPGECEFLEGEILVRVWMVDVAMGEGADLREFEQLLQQDYPDLSGGNELPPATGSLDRFQVYRMLLAPLAQVEQPRHSHPEGDALYHSLQVFQRACEELPYDEEFLLAALLHDIGKGIDPYDHVRAGLQALQGYITERTAWFIEHHSEARKILENRLGARARRRLQQHPDYEELLLLARLDRAGRIPGGAAPELDEALEFVRNLARMCGT